MAFTSVVTPVPAQAPGTGLLASAIPGTDVGWERGLAWRPEQCISAQGFSPCGIPSGVPDIADNETQYYVPPGYRVRDICSTLGGILDTTRLARQVDAVADYVVAHELWTGALTRADPEVVNGDPTHTNAYLSDGSAQIVTPGADVLTSLGALEQAAMQASHGQQVFIHVPIHVVLPIAQDLRRVGRVLYTPNDSVIVPDAGYDGSGAFTPGTHAVQTVTITGAPTGGTFTLTYAGQTTAPIAFNATAAQVSTALVALSNVAPGDLAVTGAAGGPYTVTFSTPGVKAQMTASGTGLTGGTAPAVAVATTTAGTADGSTAGQWAYATGPVKYWLSATEFIDQPSQTVLRDINSQEIWGSKMFAATYDPCTHFAVKLSA